MIQFPTHPDIIGTNLLTKFHEDQRKNVASRVFTRKTVPPTGGNVFKQTRTTFKLIQHIIKTNILTNFTLDPDSFGTKLLTKFHEDRKRNEPSRVKTAPLAKNVTSRVFKCFHYIHIETNAQPTGGHVFSPIWTIFELIRDINKINVLTNTHDDWPKIVTSRVLTMKTAPPTGGHIGNEIFELDRDFIGTKFHQDRTINVDGRTDDGQRPVTKAHLSNQFNAKHPIFFINDPGSF
ncbi:hypothetical protein DPMN_051484 [Dreissena polymorpha]|uniref:Uncharacterized protein n=1 Tax=Dreissena polymorpha TaxID=45954 RepID=A0A9D4HNY8_DREPO|nr:hypothetical protein DPMN_051484 [Dreissena polymorpha]